jgi:hypothetical protein
VGVRRRPAHLLPAGNRWVRILRGLEVVKVSVVEKIFKDCAGIFASDSEQPAPQRLELLMLFLRGLSYSINGKKIAH